MALDNSLFMRACRRQPVERTPVWFMRQAGRYMPEYRAIRSVNSLLDICHQPELAAEVTLQPVRALGVDAAVIFADILLMLVPMGLELEYAVGDGPVIHNPIQSAADVEALRPVDPQTDLDFVLEAERLVARELAGQIPLIGFSGAPFTLASYMLEGGASRSFLKTKGLMYSDPATWHQLLEKVADNVASYLVAQVSAGVQAIQLFDSWVGCLAPDDYAEFVLPHSRRVLQAVAETGVPVIHFGTDTATLLPHMRQAGGDVFGLDWRLPLDQGWALLGHEVAVQGNLDPAALFAPREALEGRVRAVLERAGGRPGHIFNLGHGILPGTPVDNVKAVVEWVHAFALPEAA